MRVNGEGAMIAWLVTLQVVVPLQVEWRRPDGYDSMSRPAEQGSEEVFHIQIQMVSKSERK